MKDVYPVPDEFKKTARTTEAEYFQRYQQSIDDPDTYWAEQAQRLDWIKPFTQVKNTNFDPEHFKIEWFADGQLNVSANCLDRHLKEHPHKPAIIWEGDHPSRHKVVSFASLHDETCRFANVLKKNGVQKRRSGGAVHADGFRSCDCHAGLRADWCSALCGFWWFFSRCFG